MLDTYEIGGARIIKAKSVLNAIDIKSTNSKRNKVGIITVAKFVQKRIYQKRIVRTYEREIIFFLPPTSASPRINCSAMPAIAPVFGSL